ncbi:MAG TPA: stalk domain-containing protein [Ruminiclostridium sp.]|nr:stalk domain-containing protein [Ruminiclostridium sp.]
MKKLIAAFLSVSIVFSILVTGASATETAAAGSSFYVSVNRLYVENNGYNLNVITPYFQGFEGADKVNQFIQDGDIQNVGDINQVFDYNKKDSKDNGGYPISVGLGGTYIYSRNGDILSVRLDRYNYTGGAHGSSWIDAITMNTGTGKTYSKISDIFKTGSAWQSFIKNSIVKQIGDRDKKSIKTGGYPIFFDDAEATIKAYDNNFNYYIDGNTLVIYFEEYELAPYASGIPKFSFTAQSLKNLLNTDVYKSMVNAKPTGKVTLNGTTLSTLKAPYQKNYITMVPVADIGKALGYNVGWDAKNKTATIGGAILRSGVNKYAVGKAKPVSLTAAPELVKGSMYVPEEFFSSILHQAVSANDEGVRLYTNYDSTNKFYQMLSGFKYPESAAECVQMFAQARKDRNGVIQYALSNDVLKSSMRKQLIDANWVTGSASPEITGFETKSTGTNLYSVIFNWDQSKGTVPDTKTDITIDKNAFIISGIKEEDPGISESAAIDKVKAVLGNIGDKCGLEVDNVQNKDGVDYYVVKYYQTVVDDPSTGESHISTIDWFYVNKHTGEVYLWDIVQDKLNPAAPHS